MNEYTVINDRDPLIESASAADFNTSKNNLKFAPVMAALRGMVVNPFFSIAERPDIDLSTGETLGTEKYYYDGWKAAATGTAVAKIINDVYDGDDFVEVPAAKCEVTALGNLSSYIKQEIDLNELLWVKNYNLRISAYVKSNSSDCKLMVRKDSSYSWVSHSGGGEWERLVLDISKNSYSSSFEVLAAINTTGVGVPASVGVGDYFTVSGVMISLQDDFEVQSRTYEEELALCRRNQNTSSGQSNVQNENLNGAIEWDLMSGDVKDFTLTAASTISFKNARGGQSGFFGVKQDGSTIYSLAATGTTLYGTTLAAPDAVSKIDHWSYAVHDFGGTIYIVLSRVDNFTGL